MKKIALILILMVLTSIASATTVRVYVEDVNGLAAIKYECVDSDKTTVRAFGLDVFVSSGTITGISGYHQGESTEAAQGYGIFPSSFSQYITVDPNNGLVDSWTVADYTPLANPEHPGTQPGLGTNAVTLEFGGLWDVTKYDAIPSASGTLCMLKLSEEATVTIEANTVRAGETGVVLINYTETPTVLYESADVSPQ